MISFPKYGAFVVFASDFNTRKVRGESYNNPMLKQKSIRLIRL